MVPGYLNHVTITKHKVQSTKYKAQSTKYKALSAFYICLASLAIPGALAISVSQWQMALPLLILPNRYLPRVVSITRNADAPDRIRQSILTQTFGPLDHDHRMSRSLVTRPNQLHVQLRHQDPDGTDRCDKARDALYTDLRG